MPKPFPRCALVWMTSLCTLALLITGCSSTPPTVTSPPSNPTTPTTTPEKSAERRKLAVVFLTSSNLMEANFTVDTLGPWLRTARSDCEEILAKEQNPPQLLVQIALRKNGDPVYEFSGRPKLTEQLEATLREALSPLPPIHPLFCDVSVRLQQVDDKAGNPIAQASRFDPQLVSPDQRALDQFAKANVADEYVQLRKWAREIALPILGVTNRGADPKFVGVVNIGKLLSETQLAKPIDVEALTFRNPDYWRGVMEMAPGNAGITATSVLLFVANGEFDKADKLSQLVRSFSDNSSLGSNLLDLFQSHSEIITQKVNTEISRGIKLHDAGKYDEAIAVYRKVLEDYPCSAWARYELFFSELSKQGPEAMIKKGAESWNAAAPEIYRCDPLYSTQFFGEKGKTKGALFDRLALRSLKVTKALEPGEYIGRTAELALRLECYGYAAHIYWLSLHTKLTLKESGLENKKELTALKIDDILCRYLYCLEKLGCTELKKNFKDDFSVQFKEFDEKLDAHRKQ